jgi:hypothetical protein
MTLDHESLPRGPLVSRMAKLGTFLGCGTAFQGPVEAKPSQRVSTPMAWGTMSENGETVTSEIVTVSAGGSICGVFPGPAILAFHVPLGRADPIIRW